MLSRRHGLLLVGVTAAATVVMSSLHTAAIAASGGGANVQAPDGATIVGDPELFSSAVRAEFVDMNERFGDLGFELEVFQDPPSLSEITSKYGEPKRSEEVDVTLGLGADQRRAVLVFAYFGDIGFGVLPDDRDQVVLRIKRREE